MSNDVNIIEGANRLQSLVDKQDALIEDLLGKIDNSLEEMSEALSPKVKYETVVSIEYLIIRLRTLVEFEHIKVKKILSSDGVMPTVKAFFVKRDVYLAQITQKITTIQTDISILTKLVYQQNFNK